MTPVNATRQTNIESNSDYDPDDKDYTRVADAVDKLMEIDRAFADAITIDTVGTYTSRLWMRDLTKDMANYRDEEKCHEYDTYGIPDEALFQPMRKKDDDVAVGLIWFCYGSMGQIGRAIC